MKSPANAYGAKTRVIKETNNSIDNFVGLFYAENINFIAHAINVARAVVANSNFQRVVCAVKIGTIEVACKIKVVRLAKIRV